MKDLLFYCIFFIIPSTLLLASQSQPKQTHQFGLGIASIITQSPYTPNGKTKRIIVPGLFYRHEKIEFNGIQIKVKCFQKYKTNISLSIKPKFGAYKENDTAQLNNMGDRKITGLAGLTLQRRTAKYLNIQADFHHDLFNRFNGSIANINIGTAFPVHKTTFIFPGFGFNWLSKAMANDDYGVPINKETETRNAYQLTNTINKQLTLTSIVKPSKQWLFLANVSMIMFGKEIKKSPIVQKKRLVTSVVSINYLF